MQTNTRRGPALARRLGLLGGALAIAVVAMLFPVPRASREANAVMDLGHIVLFGILALVLRWLLIVSGCPARAVNLGAWGLITGFGGAMELIQARFGRHPSWQDLWADALGAGGFLLAANLGYWPRGAGRAAAWSAVAVLVLAAALQPCLVLCDGFFQRRDWPWLADFEQPLEIMRWEFHGVRAARSQVQVSHGRESLRLEFGTGKYAAATYVWPLPDWSSYRALVCDLWVDEGPPLVMFVKIEDVAHNGRAADRYEVAHRFQPGWNRLELALDGVAQAPQGRRLDLSGVMRFQLYTAALPHPRVAYLDAVRLEH